MANQPEAKATWLDSKEQADKVGEAVDGLSPPPVPNDDWGMSVNMLKHHAERLRVIAESEVRKEYGEEQT
jgi:hypothetical protein